LARVQGRAVRRTRTSSSSDQRVESIVASPASSQRLQISALRPSPPRESRWKRGTASMEGALVRRNRRPLTRRRWQRIWRSLRGSATESVRGGYVTVPVAEYATGRERPRRVLDQEPAGPSGAGPQGNRGTSTARPKLGARRQARPYPRSRRSPKLRLGGRPWKPPSEAKVEDGGDSGVDRFKGARVVMSVAEVG